MDITSNLDSLSININKTLPIVSIVFIGHVDAGKSTIGGQILHQLNLIDSRTLDRYRQESTSLNRESWYLSWAFDTTPEERSKGKTTEVGKASFILNNFDNNTRCYKNPKKVIVLDTPGHAMYVSNMISGANQADIAVLIVSARPNEFETGFIKGGQTKEHILLAKAGNIKKLVILVNKMDTIDWSHTRYTEIKDKLHTFISKLYTDAIYIPISGYKGDNILDNIKETVCDWYKGESFLEYLGNLKYDRCVSDYFVLNIAEKNKMLGNLIYGGKIESGHIAKGMDVQLYPHMIKTQVTGIYDDEDLEIEGGGVGDSVKIKLKDNVDACEGDVLASVGCIDLKVCKVFTCMLSVLDAKNILAIGYKSILHVRMMSKPCKLVEIRAIKKSGTGIKKVKVPYVKKGEKVLVKIMVESPVVLYCGEDSSRMDKFALRDEGLTIAIGVVRNIIE